MLASSFSSVLLPEPLRPTMPKNSPWRISKETPSRARSSRYSRAANGRTTRSLSESTRWVGMRKDLCSPSTWIASGSLGGMNARTLPRCGGGRDGREALAGDDDAESGRRSRDPRFAQAFGGAGSGAGAQRLAPGGFPAPFGVADIEGDRHPPEQEGDREGDGGAGEEDDQEGPAEALPGLAAEAFAEGRPVDHALDVGGPDVAGPDRFDL